MTKKELNKIADDIQEIIKKSRAGFFVNKGEKLEVLVNERFIMRLCGCDIVLRTAQDPRFLDRAEGVIRDIIEREYRQPTERELKEEIERDLGIKNTDFTLDKKVYYVIVMATLLALIMFAIIGMVVWVFVRIFV